MSHMEIGVRDLRNRTAQVIAAVIGQTDLTKLQFVGLNKNEIHGKKGERRKAKG